MLVPTITGCHLDGDPAKGTEKEQSKIQEENQERRHLTNLERRKHGKEVGTSIAKGFRVLRKDED